VTLPNFIVIGAMKAGTTSLYTYLGSHPQVFMSAIKEPEFFVAERNHSLDWYKGLFDEAGDAAAIGEASTDYSKYPMWKGVPERLAALLPDVKLIYLVRHPIQRLLSHYRHLLERREVDSPPEVALLEDPMFVDHSRYAMQIDQYFQFFPRESLLVLKSEDLRADRDVTMRRVYRFLGVDPEWRDPSFDHEFHLGAEKIGTRASIRRLREIPAYRALSARVPSRVKVGLERHTPLVKGRLRETRVDRKVLIELEKRVREDVARLHAWMPPSFDGWGIT
jgi:hypothetical protein